MHRLICCLLLAAGVAGAAPPGQDVKLRAPLPPLILYPACPCYHVLGEGKGDTKINARVTVNSERRPGLRLVAELSDAAGKIVQTGGTDASGGGIVGLNLQVPVSQVAAFDLTVRLIDRAGKEIAQQKTDVHVAERAPSQVRIGADGFLRVAGEPHFPIGMYSCGHYPEMTAAGFSVTHSYGVSAGDTNDVISLSDRNLKVLLDLSWSNRMRMMVELPRKAIEKSQWQSVRHRIETFRHHPGLLCWGSEERVARGLTSLTNMAVLYNLVHELDPDHPFVLGDTRDVIKKFQTNRQDMFPDAQMDIGVWWWYPIPLKEPDGNGLEAEKTLAGRLEPPSWLTTTQSRRPLWIAIQSYQKKTKGARFPTPAEYRCQAYLSIITGVKGLFFYTGSGQLDAEGKPSGLLNKPDESHWDYVQKLVRELRDFSPVVMAPSPAPTERPSLSPADAPVSFAMRELDGRRYLIAANRSDKDTSVQFKGTTLAKTKATTLFETREVKVEEETLADKFEPYGVHVYKLEKAGP